jgi:penicillin G amidase
VLEDDRGDAYSLRVPADVLGDLGFDALVPLLRARTVDDVLAAFDRWVEPVNNLLVADDGGRVRQRVVGRVPRRHEDNRWEPVPGDSVEHAWRGWVDLPGRDVEPGEHLVTANQRMTGFDEVGVEFSSSARADRIHALLQGREDLTVADCEQIHGDVLAGQPAHLHLALAGLHGLDGEAERLRNEILAWDQRFTVDSREAAAYVAVREELVRRIARSEQLTGLDASPYPALLDRWTAVETQVYLSLANLLSDEGLALLPRRDELLRQAVEAVATGATPHSAAATWGERHRYCPPHALDVLGSRHGTAGGTPLAGDNDCVRCAGLVPGTAVAVRGSVARYAWDLGGIPASGWVVPQGVDGRPGHPHHADQLPWWAEARLLAVECMELVTPSADRPSTYGP